MHSSTDLSVWCHYYKLSAIRWKGQSAGNGFILSNNQPRGNETKRETSTLNVKSYLGKFIQVCVRLVLKLNTIRKFVVSHWTRPIFNHTVGVSRYNSIEHMVVLPIKYQTMVQQYQYSTINRSPLDLTWVSKNNKFGYGWTNGGQGLMMQNPQC